MIAPPPVRVYFHGLPGTSDELDRLGFASQGVAGIERNHIAAGQSGDDFFHALAADVAQRGAHLHLIGFSLGAAAALRVAARLQEAVVHIDLIAPAAPPELGDFFAAAAGGPIFRLAAERPRVFALVVKLQSLIARHCSLALVRALFANCAGEDRNLAADVEFRRAMAGILRDGLGACPGNYRREIAAYVMPWADRLAAIKAPVTIWQGDADNWSPPAMARALAASLPNVAGLHMMPGLSHYSVLKAAMPQILLE